MSSPTSRTIRAGVSYFALVFAAGFVLGVVRELWLAGFLGVRSRELLEMPFMLVVIVLAARWTVRRFALLGDPRARLGAGGIAVVLLLAAELSLVLAAPGMTLADYVSSRDPVSGAVYLIMLAVFAVMPALLPRASPPM